MTCPVEWTDPIGCYPPGPHHCTTQVEHDSHTCACGAFLACVDSATAVLAQPHEPLAPVDPLVDAVLWGARHLRR